jgi:hypothetical protein
MCGATGFEKFIIYSLPRQRRGTPCYGGKTSIKKNPYAASIWVKLI